MSPAFLRSACMSPASTPASPAALRRARVPALGAVAVALATVLSSCGGPTTPRWAALPDTVILYSLALSAPHLPNAFSFHQQTSYQVENPNSTGLWDVALDTRNGHLVLVPPLVLNIYSGAGVAAMPGVNFDDLALAPKDSTLYVKDAPIPLETGMVYAIRTAESLGVYGQVCVYFAKMEALQIDASAGTLKFVSEDNPTCNDRRLVPPK